MMASHVRLKRDKVAAQDYDSQIKEVRGQLVEQLKVFDQQLEQKSQLLQDLGDYLRRRGEIEAEYARSLDKLADRFSSRIKRKEQNGQSVLQCWLALLGQTRQEGRDHAAVSDMCSTSLPQNLSLCLEHTQRLAKRTKEVCSLVQEDLLKVTTEMQTMLKTYHQYHTEFVSAEGKLKEAEKQKQGAKKVEKLIEKRQGKVQEIQFKCTKARNDYLLSLATANASMNKYYLQDISNLIDTSDVGYHPWVCRVLQGFVSGQSRLQQSLGSQLTQLSGAVATLDQVKDRDTLLQAHDTTFTLPLSFKYLPHEGDPVCEVQADFDMQDELETRFQQMESRLETFTKDAERAGETLEEALSAMVTVIGDEDLGTPTDPNATQSQEPSLAKRRANLQEMESFYFTKVKEQLQSMSVISKLQAKHEILQVALQKARVNGENNTSNRSRRSLRQQRSYRKSHPGTQVNQKLFTGNLLSYIEASRQNIPRVMKSCIRFINLNGLHHEGIFRVPGLQVEINSLRDAFENGEDPLADGMSDMDSVAGVLKLYCRSLEQPLFPEDSFTQLMDCVAIENESEKCAQIKAVISSYPKPLIIVMRYLFAFLNHVSQYSDENMMLPYNLAVCFGPSLIRGPEDADASTLQKINALVKSIVIQHESIFPGQAELPGPSYEKCMTLEPDDCEQNVDEVEVDLDSPSMREDLEAVALFDYTARSSTELSFRKGEHLTLHSKPSDDWWRGESNGARGLIPHKYISITGPDAAKRSEKRNSTGTLDEVDITSQKSSSRERAGSLGVGGVHGGKASLNLPKGHIIMPATSPDVFRKHLHPQVRKGAVDETGHSGSTENMLIKVDKEVCQQMNHVFHELLSRHPLVDPKGTNSSGGSTAPSSLPLHHHQQQQSQQPSHLPHKKTAFSRKGKDQQSR